jgi:predicted flap endonuclease-1-like 5' DNA nuclease
MDTIPPPASRTNPAAMAACVDAAGCASDHHTLNDTLAANLREYADLLAQQEADGFRTSAYRRAAETIAALERPVSRIFATEGRDGLMALPGIGPSIAAAMSEMLTTGRWSQLERLRGDLEPENLFQTIPGIGPELAARLHDHLEAESLESLEIAAHDGRLEAVPGIGRRRAEMIRALLAERLGQRRLRRMSARQVQVRIDLLLDVDREYREKAEAGRLRLIAPRRFNPKGEAWLPVLHTRRGDWQFTALFSNTRLAHEVGRNRDWVVIYYHTGTTPEGQCTVVTETRGPLAGKRVVRGREEECRPYYTDR